VPRFGDLVVGEPVDLAGADVVTNAPELARLTLNVAAVHHDAAAAGGQRLVYGGHTIGIALSQCARALPSLVTVVGWHGCDHLAPVHEGDRLHSALAVERLDPLTSGGLAHLRCTVFAGPDRTPVLDWRFVAVIA
jgi:acyl dehydratase